MTTLRKCFDNVTHSSDKWEPYFDIYERHLSRYIGKKFNMVEVGVQRGGSLEMWSNYFGAQMHITGVDVDTECAKLQYKEKNIDVVIGDQGDAKFWDDFLTKHTKIDVFIDDGGHFMDQQILTFEKVFPKMPVGSIFICEDCHTSYMPYNGGGLNRPGTFIEYAKDYIDVLHYSWKESSTDVLEKKYAIGEGLTGVYFYDSVVVFEKFGKVNMKTVFPPLNKE